MLDLVCKVGSDKLLLAEVPGLADVLDVHFYKFHFLCEVGMLLVILAVMVEVSEEPPVIEVIDHIFKESITGLVAPKSVTEPGGERLHWLVSGVVRGSIQFNDLGLLLSLGPSVEPSDPSIVELLDEAGKPLHAIVQGNCEVGESLSILLISRQAFCKSSNDGLELIWGQVKCGSKDILHRGGREGKAPGVSCGKSNSSNIFSDLANPKGIVVPKAEVPWEAVPVLFRG